MIDLKGLRSSVRPAWLSPVGRDIRRPRGWRWLLLGALLMFGSAGAQEAETPQESAWSKQAEAPQPRLSEQTREIEATDASADVEGPADAEAHAESEQGEVSGQGDASAEGEVSGQGDAPEQEAPLDIRPLAATCSNCHGFEGVSVGGSMASIAGQSEEFLRGVMQEWRTGERFSTTMGRLLAGYSEAEIDALAAYFAALPWTPAEQSIDSALAAQGKTPAGRCVRCHGLTGGRPRTEDTPRIDGQWLGHFQLEMEKYRDENLEFPHEKMQESVRKLEPEEVPLVSKFFSNQRGR